MAERQYHVETKLPNGEPALLLDIGSVGNLAGDQWVQEQARAAMHNGLRPEQKRRERPLTVGGVGKGSQQCTRNCTLPIAVSTSDGGVATGTYETPTIPNSQLPALLGLNACRESRMLIDTVTNRVYMMGPGNYDLEQMLPPGTRSFQCTLAPSGHLMLPCAHFSRNSTAQQAGGLRLEPTLSLPVQVSGASSSSAPPPREC